MCWCTHVPFPSWRLAAACLPRMPAFRHKGARARTSTCEEKKSRGFLVETRGFSLLPNQKRHELPRCTNQK
jgi:hypothetical protein